jgi:hypothetical protein
MIDAFGHSAGNAALFADFGFDSLFFARLNRNDRNQYKKEKKMTFLWEPNPENYGSSKRILTHVFPEHYSGPSDFNMENKDALWALPDSNRNSTNYEFAAMLRDLEKDLTIPIKAYGQETTDWQRVSSLDSFKYYDRIERLIDKYSTDKTNEELKNCLKQLHDVVMISIIRQEIISKILGENEQQ